jgi:hypothetical protein
MPLRRRRGAVCPLDAAHLRVDVIDIVPPVVDDAAQVKGANEVWGVCMAGRQSGGWSGGGRDGNRVPGWAWKLYCVSYFTLDKTVKLLCIYKSRN